MNPSKSFAILVAAIVCTSAANCALGDTFGSGANTFDIEFVDIGNPGNPADTTGDPNPAGSVPYAFRMGQFEISEQMIDKANALGGLGITKDTRGPNKPATSVSWFEAARFVNWLNTSTGNPAAYKFGPQGNFELWTAGDAGYNPANRYRNDLARYVLPSLDEWYKAAYYDPSAGIYYNYPTGSDSEPDGIDFAGDPNYDAVFADSFDEGQPHDITNVGVPSPFGVNGLGGNVWEWHETDFDLVNDANTSDRSIGGGSWFSNASSMVSSGHYVESNSPPDVGHFYVGLRVASVPEPAGAILASTGIAVFWALAARRRLPDHSRRRRPTPSQLM